MSSLITLSAGGASVGPGFVSFLSELLDLAPRPGSSDLSLTPQVHGSWYFLPAVLMSPLISLSPPAGVEGAWLISSLISASLGA